MSRAKKSCEERLHRHVHDCHAVGICSAGFRASSRLWHSGRLGMDFTSVPTLVTGFSVPTMPGPARAGPKQADGPTGGVLVGYNVDMGDYILGIEADTSFGDLSNSTVIGGIGNVRVSNHGQHTLRARAGMDIGTGLLYATGGLAMSDIWLTAGGVQDKNFLWGGVVGAGYEAKVTDNITLRAEYLYAVYAEETYQLTAPVSVEYETHGVRAGVAWQF